MDKPARLVACPHCGSRRPWDPANRFRPFCSERCKLIDFGAWATGEYRIPDSSTPGRTGGGEGEEQGAP